MDESVRDKGTAKEHGDDSIFDPSLECVKRKTQSSVAYQSLRPLDNNLKGNNDRNPSRDLEIEIDRVRNEQEEIRSYQSYCETRSERLERYRLEEEKKKLLMLDNEKSLKLEVEKKQKAEAELLKKIKQMEIQEHDLNRKRVENEMKEREVFEYRKRDQEMTKRLHLLREKEKLLLERLELKKRESLIHVKNEFPRETIEKPEEVALLSSTPYRARDSQCDQKPYRARDGQYDQKPYRAKDSHYDRKLEPYRAKDSLYDRVPDYSRAEDRHYEREPTLYRSRYNMRETVTQPRDRDAQKIGESPDNFPLFKIGLPKVPNFSGKQFEQWKMEVNCLMRAKIYPDYAIAQAVRNSLKDDTRQILLTLKPTSTTMDILKKVEEGYGNVKTGDNIVHEFYSAKQREKELVSAWGIRLETLFQQAVDKGELDEKKRDMKCIF